VKILSASLAIAGLCLSTALVAWFGAGNVLAGALRVGWGGFGLLCLWQLALFALLGFAWDIIVPRRSRHLSVFVWGRMVRDAAINCLPFSQLGGFVIGARAVTLHGTGWVLATASTVVDITAEFIAQLAFTGIGLSVLIARAPRSPLAVPVEVGLGLAVAVAVGMIAAQKGAGSLFARIGRRIAGRRFGGAQEGMALLQGEMTRIYGQSAHLFAGFFLHLLGWLGTAGTGWLAYHLLGVPIDFDDALAIESLLAAASAVAFLVPVNAGVQEAGYVGLGAIFGIPPELSLAVSLVRRARDLALGVPILLVWQLFELRRLKAGRAASA
jgi:glycosyltransferase 2 family protein